MVIRDTASHSGLPRGIHVHRDGRLTMDHNGGALPPSGSSAGGVPNGLAGELPHVMDAVAFATQALENLQGRLERTLRAKDAEMLSVQGRLDKAFESCRAEIEVVASTTSEDLGAALANLKQRDDLLIAAKGELSQAATTVASFQEADERLRLEAHKATQRCKGLEDELAFRAVDSQRLEETLSRREQDYRAAKEEGRESKARAESIADDLDGERKAHAVELKKLKLRWETEVKEKDEEIGQLYDQCSEANHALTDLKAKTKKLEVQR